MSSLLLPTKDGSYLDEGCASNTDDERTPTSGRHGSKNASLARLGMGMRRVRDSGPGMLMCPVKVARGYEQASYEVRRVPRLGQGLAR